MEKKIVLIIIVILGILFFLGFALLGGYVLYMNFVSGEPSVGTIAGAIFIGIGIGGIVGMVMDLKESV